MNVIYGIGKLNTTFKNPVVAIGIFDGIHVGHQKLIRKAIERAHGIKGTSFVLTFFPHPIHVLYPEAFSPLINSLRYRIKLIEKMGIDVCVVLRFTKRFAHVLPEYFIKNYIVRKINPKEIVIGDDFRFGRDRAGTLEDFKNMGLRYGFKLHAIRTKWKSEKTVSSSRVRKAILGGELMRASQMLNRPVSILGRVVHGDSRGKTLGYPTANINPGNEIIPPSGVYIVNVCYKGKKYHGLANVGRKPSFKRIKKVNIEVHIFQFKKNLYNQDIIVEFMKKIRDERVFHSQQDLVHQIQRDEKKAKDWLKRHS